MNGVWLRWNALIAFLHSPNSFVFEVGGEERGELIADPGALKLEDAVRYAEHSMMRAFYSPPELSGEWKENSRNTCFVDFGALKKDYSLQGGNLALIVSGKGKKRERLTLPEALRVGGVDLLSKLAFVEFGADSERGVFGTAGVKTALSCPLQDALSKFVRYLDAEGVQHITRGLSSEAGAIRYYFGGLVVGEQADLMASVGNGYVLGRPDLLVSLHPALYKENSKGKIKAEVLLNALSPFSFSAERDILLVEVKAPKKEVEVTSMGALQYFINSKPHYLAQLLVYHIILKKLGFNPLPALLTLHSKGDFLLIIPRNKVGKVEEELEAYMRETARTSISYQKKIQKHLKEGAGQHLKEGAGQILFKIPKKPSIHCFFCPYRNTICKPNIKDDENTLRKIMSKLEAVTLEKFFW